MVHHLGTSTELAEVVWLASIYDGAVNLPGVFRRAPKLEPEFARDALSQAQELRAVYGELLVVHELNVLNPLGRNLVEKLCASRTLNLKEEPIMGD